LQRHAAESAAAQCINYAFYAFQAATPPPHQALEEEQLARRDQAVADAMLVVAHPAHARSPGAQRDDGAPDGARLAEARHF
jgi:hypothetical protein